MPTIESDTPARLPWWWSNTASIDGVADAGLMIARAIGAVILLAGVLFVLTCAVLVT